MPAFKHMLRFRPSQATASSRAAGYTDASSAGSAPASVSAFSFAPTSVSTYARASHMGQAASSDAVRASDTSGAAPADASDSARADALGSAPAGGFGSARIASSNASHAETPRPLYRYAPDAVSDGTQIMPYVAVPGSTQAGAPNFAHADAPAQEPTHIPGQTAENPQGATPGDSVSASASAQAFGGAAGSGASTGTCVSGAPSRDGSLWKSKASQRTASQSSVDLRKLSRAQLLALLRDAVEENERLHAELDEAHRQLDERRIVLEDSESLAEAALRLSGTLDGARTAAALYGENVDAPRGRHAAPARTAGQDPARSSAMTGASTAAASRLGQSTARTSGQASGAPSACEDWSRGSGATGIDEPCDTGAASIDASRDANATSTDTLCNAHAVDASASLSTSPHGEHEAAHTLAAKAVASADQTAAAVAAAGSPTDEASAMPEVRSWKSWLDSIGSNIEPMRRCAPSAKGGSAHERPVFE
jgi:hypothetical protein